MCSPSELRPIPKRECLAVEEDQSEWVSDPDLDALLAAPASVPRGCPGRHTLTTQTVNEPNWTCDVCKGMIPIHDVSRSCRQCNFDMCSDCYGSPELVERYSHQRGGGTDTSSSTSTPQVEGAANTGGFHHPRRGPSNVKTAEGQENSQDEPATSEENRCIICLVNRRCVLLYPCGHLCVCVGCSSKIESCPVCRAPTSDLVKVFGAATDPEVAAAVDNTSPDPEMSTKLLHLRSHYEDSISHQMSDLISSFMDLPQDSSGPLPEQLSTSNEGGGSD